MKELSKKVLPCPGGHLVRVHRLSELDAEPYRRVESLGQRVLYSTSPCHLFLVQDLLGQDLFVQDLQAPILKGYAISVGSLDMLLRTTRSTVFITIFASNEGIIKTTACFGASSHRVLSQRCMP